MNNSSVSRSNHSTRVLVSICFVILLCVVIALCFSKINAANIVRRTVSMYLDENRFPTHLFMLTIKPCLWSFSPAEKAVVHLMM